MNAKPDRRVGDADRRLRREQAATSASVAPSAISRAASIPCVNGSTDEIACIQPGSWSIGTLAPVNDEEDPEHDVGEHGLLAHAAGPSPAPISPKPVQREGADRRREQERREGAGRNVDPDDQPADDEREGGDEEAVDHDGHGAARGRAGAARRG